jgi:hypothetical protein
MTKFYLLADTEITAAEAELAQLKNAMATPPDNCRNPVPDDKGQTASAQGVC